MTGSTIVGKTYNVLILGAANSARSIMAEALFNTMGHGVFKAYSAGSAPIGVISRFAIEEIRNTGYPVENLKSKHWGEFTHAGRVSKILCKRRLTTAEAFSPRTVW